MVVWELDRREGEFLSLVELKSIVSAFSSFSWNLLSVIQFLVSQMHVLRLFLVSSYCSGLHDLHSWVSSEKNWCGQEWLDRICERGCVYRTKRIGPSTEPCGTPQSIMVSMMKLMPFTKHTSACLTCMTRTRLQGPDQRHERVVQGGATVWSGQSVVSNAADTSSRIRIYIWLASEAVRISLTMTCKEELFQHYD